MFKKPLIIAVIIAILLSLTPSLVLAYIPPLPPTDCGVWAYDPVKSGSYVNGKAEVSCATNHSSLRVVAGIRDSPNNRYTSEQKICYNTNYCSVTASLSYYSGRSWQADVSGYVTDISWQAYYATNWISIP